MTTSQSHRPSDFALVTVFDTNYEVGFPCATSQAAYAARHGYHQLCKVLPAAEMAKLCAGRAPQWGKVALLHILLKEISERSFSWAPASWASVRWLVWVDADAIILNHDRSLEELVAMAPSSCDFVIGEDMSCASVVNTGVFFVKVGAWSRQLLEELWGCDPALHHGPFHEQTALSRKLQSEVVMEDNDQWWSWLGGPRRKSVGEHIFVLDCGTLNYKQPEQAQFAVHFVDKPRSGPSKLERARSVLENGWVRGGVRLTTPPCRGAEAAVSLWNSACSGGGREGWPAVAAAVGEKLTVRLLQMPASEFSFKLLEAELGEELVVLEELAPRRACDGYKDMNRVKLWQLCGYVQGRFPPLHPLLSGSDGEGAKRWQLSAWRPRGRQLPSAPPGLEDKLKDDAWAELRVAPPGAEVRLHRDNHGTQLLLAQLKGRCQVALFPPEATKKLLAASPKTYDEAQSSWDPWLEKDGERVTLEKGQAVLIPTGWWHATRALTPSLQLARHVVNSENAAGFAAKQRAAQEAVAALQRPNPRLPGKFAAGMAALETSRRWSSACEEGLKSTPDGAWCVGHMELAAADGRVLYSSRVPAGSPPRLFRVGDSKQHWTAALAGAAARHVAAGERGRVVLAPALVCSTAPEAPFPLNSPALVDLELFTVSLEEDAAPLSCVVCQATAPLVCTRSQRRYCSKPCQKADWKSNHPSSSSSAKPKRLEELEPRSLCAAGEKRGIVICAGGPYLNLAWLSLKILRTFCNCKLPVEVWHLPGEVPPAAKAALQAIPGVVLRQLNVPLRRKRPDIWAVKPLAVASSAFKEVLLLDADNLPSADPLALFSCGAYEKFGALFWPDFPPYPEKQGRRTWQALSAGRWESRPSAISWEMESGQLLLDKGRNSAALQKLVELALHLGELAPHLPGDGGDKDLFQIAFALEEQPFCLVPFTPAAAGVAYPDRRQLSTGPFVGHTMVQHCPEGRPMFLHRTIDKHEDGLTLNWPLVAKAKGGLLGQKPGLGLQRICPEAKIKARIVPVAAEAVELRSFEDYVPRGGRLKQHFAELVEELRVQPWAGMDGN